MKVREQLTGTIGLTKSVSLSFYKIVQNIFSEYDPNYFCDYAVIKTISHIDLTRYSPGDGIDVCEEPAIQTITFVYPDNHKNTYKLKTPMKGFPVNIQLLKPLINDRSPENIM